MLRSTSARLAVLLLTIPILISTGSEGRADECVTNPSGIECSYDGGSSGGGSPGGGSPGSGGSGGELPPIRYLGTADHHTRGQCWYWSRYPPGYDSHDPYFDAAIIITRATYPRCDDTSSGTTVPPVDPVARAWDVFRSWTLAVPAPQVRPEVGITNLDSILTAPAPTALTHAETLPDGRVLEVRAEVASVRVDWGDGSPRFSYPASALVSGGAAHTYGLKTCPADYRAAHPSGPSCHPTLAAYPLTVTFTWEARYRDGGAWTTLDTVERTTTLAYDVDEVVGIPVLP